MVVVFFRLNSKEEEEKRLTKKDRRKRLTKKDRLTKKTDETKKGLMF